MTESGKPFGFKWLTPGVTTHAEILQRMAEAEANAVYSDCDLRRRTPNVLYLRGLGWNFTVGTVPLDPRLTLIDDVLAAATGTVYPVEYDKVLLALVGKFGQSKRETVWENEVSAVRLESSQDGQFSLTIRHKLLAKAVDDLVAGAKAAAEAERVARICSDI